MPSSGTSLTAVSRSSGSNNNPPNPHNQRDARAAVLGTLHTVGSNYDAHLQRRAADLHANAAAITKQQSQLKKQAASLTKETSKWQREVTRATKGLNEFGDLQNWAETMERDFLVLEETLRLAEGGERAESASGGSQWR